MFYMDFTMLLMIPGLLLGLYAQIKVQNAYHKQSKMPSRSGYTGAQAAREILARGGNDTVTVERGHGELSDHYDPRTEQLRLSPGVYDGSSLASLGIAAHEAGHAMQKKQGYAPMAFRNGILPVVQLGSKAYFPLFLAGMIFSFEPLMNVGIAVFALTLLFSVITLPVEFDASRRGIRMLAEYGLIAEDERAGVKSVLDAAALTYVAAAITSLLQLLRLVLISQSRRRRD